MKSYGYSFKNKRQILYGKETIMGMGNCLSQIVFYTARIAICNNFCYDRKKIIFNAMHGYIFSSIYMKAFT